MANSYDIPSWAGKPPTGLHLDVLKEDKLVQKLMVDEKKCYLFGRNAQMNDFCIDHASCSRVHAAFVFHKQLNLAYLVDLGSTHGTFIGNLRLEPHKPTQLQINSSSTFHFGASTRKYILRERPSGHRMNIMEDLPISELSEGALLGLPESQTDLDNLTEYNTAHNRRISMLGIADDNLRKQNANKSNPRKHRNVTFNDEEIIINPEDIDPNVGRFRNLVQTTVVPSKRSRYDTNHIGMPMTHCSSLGNTNNQLFHNTILSDMKHNHNSVLTGQSLYHDLPATVHNNYENHGPSAKFPHGSSELDLTSIALGTKLGLLLPNPAPDVTPIFAEPSPLAPPPSSTLAQRIARANASAKFDEHHHPSNADEPQKKKYAKEAWPGRKQMLGPL